MSPDHPRDAPAGAPVPVADGLAYQTAAQLGAALRAGRLSALELTDHLIARIERLDTLLNAVVARDFERAREAARAADAALARGDTRPLLGVPMTVKESFRMAGLPTTWGMTEARNDVVDDDALIVTRVRAAGAVILGKTNVPLALADWQSYNAIHGVTRNPWDPARSPGGSTGGSSAALAAGFGPLSLGSDIGGSLRVPAHFCGVAALKPSHGLVPSRGHTPPGVPALPREPDLAVVGPMARSVDDLARLFDVIAGPDEQGLGVGYRLALRPPRHAALKDHRVLLLDTHPLAPTAGVIRQALDRLGDRLERAGVQVLRSHPRLPDLAEVARTYARLLMSFSAAFWPQPEYDQARGAAASIPADDRSLQAELTRGIGLSHRDWVAADQARARHQQQFAALFEQVDVVLCPPMAVTAYPHDHSEPVYLRQLDVDGQRVPYTATGLAWVSAATCAGLPAAVVPIDRGDSPLPIGVQVIGPHLEDRTVLAFAAHLERECGGFVAPPGYA